MRRLSDLSLPDPDDVAQVLRNAVSGGSTVVDPSVGSTAAVAGLSGTPLAGLIVLISRGYVQEKGVELTAKTDQKLDDIVDSLDETERRQRCLAGVLQGLQTLLPEGEQYQDPSLRTAEGDPENLAALFQTYQDDPERRHDMEAAVERVLSGDLDQDALDAEHDDFVDYLQDAFRVDTRDQAVAMFLDFRDLLQAREVHDAVASIEELEFDQEALLAKLADTERRLADRLDDVLEVGLENEGFYRLSPHYFDQPGPQAEPATCWRVGFQPADVRAGYALQREEPTTNDNSEAASASRRRVTPHLIDRLRDDEDIVVTGLPGSGKSTILQSVACQWYEQQHGTVFYRRYGQAISPFEDTGTLAERINDAEGHVLVAVEDAVRGGARAIFETLRQFEADNTVSFLFDARVSEWREDEHLTTDAIQLERKREVTEYPVPRFDERECERMIAQFESATGHEVDESPARLYSAIETDLGAGQMYLLGYRLSHYAVSPTDGGDDRPTGLRSHVRDVYNELAPAEPGGNDLPLQVGLLVALLTAADENTYREYVYALAENESDYHQIVAILDDQQGRIIYGVDAATQTYRVNHPLWGMLFLEEALERNEELTITRFESAVNAVFRLFDDTAHRERVSSWTSQETPLLQESESSISETADTFALSVFQVGVERPTLAALVGTSDNSGLELPDACTVETELYCINRRGRMFKKRGGPGEGTMEAGGVSDPYGDFSKTGDRGGSAKRSGRSDLERAATEYRRRLELAEQAEEVSPEELRKHEAASLLNLGVVAGNRGNYETAEDRLRRARSQFDSIGDDHSATSCLLNLGEVAQQRGNYETAEDRYGRARSQFDSIGDDNGVASCTANLGKIALREGDVDAAEEHYSKARERFEAIGDIYRVALTTNDLGEVAQRRGDLRQACERFETALEILLQLNLRRDAIPSHRSLEEVCEALVGDDPERVEEGLERLLAIAEQTESPDLTRRLRQTRHEMGLDGS